MSRYEEKKADDVQTYIGPPRGGEYDPEKVGHPSQAGVIHGDILVDSPSQSCGSLPRYRDKLADEVMGTQ
jgi:hypothetical protein